MIEKIRVRRFKDVNTKLNNQKGETFLPEIKNTEAIKGRTKFA